MGLISKTRPGTRSPSPENAKRSNPAGLVAGLLRRLGSFTGWRRALLQPERSPRSGRQNSGLVRRMLAGGVQHAVRRRHDLVDQEIAGGELETGLDPAPEATDLLGRLAVRRELADGEAGGERVLVVVA